MLTSILFHSKWRVEQLIRPSLRFKGPDFDDSVFAEVLAVELVGGTEVSGLKRECPWVGIGHGAHHTGGAFFRDCLVLFGCSCGVCVANDEEASDALAEALSQLGKLAGGDVIDSSGPVSEADAPA